MMNINISTNMKVLCNMPLMRAMYEIVAAVEAKKTLQCRIKRHYLEKVSTLVKLAI